MSIWYDVFAGNDPTESLIQILMDDTPPCEKLNCPWASRCKAEPIACKAFADHVAYGDKIYENQNLEDRMIPTRRVYTKLFPDSENDFHVQTT